MASVKDMGSYGFEFDNCRKISKDDFLLLVKNGCRPRKGDILIGKDGARYLEDSFVFNQDEEVVILSSIAILRPKLDLLTPQYLLYYLQNPTMKDIIKSNFGSGSAIPRMVLKDFKRVPITVPPLPQQRAIAATLSCLDDKIELNNKICANLEAQAQAIFKSWFVDYEPFQDGEFVDSELGPIPKGWRVGVFDELIEKTVSGDWGKESEIGKFTKQVYCIRGADIPEIEQGHKGKMPLRYILPANYEKKKINAGDLVIEISGGSPSQSTGRVVEVTRSLLDRYDQDMICTNFCKAVSIKEGFSRFSYRYWKYLYTQNTMFNYENGTTGIKNFDFTSFVGKHLIVIPPIEIISQYNRCTNAATKYIYESGKQIEVLIALRDALLPRLMSGEIEVPVEV